MSMPVNKGRFYLSRDKHPDECAKLIAEGLAAHIIERNIARLQLREQFPSLPDFAIDNMLNSYMRGEYSE